MRCARAAFILLAPAMLAACQTAARGKNFLSGNLSAYARHERPAAASIADPVRPEARLAALWVGHATVLVQIDDRFVLTDPVFTDTVGELSKRLVAPGLGPARLPRLDAVLISHLHFDHLSFGSLDAIEPLVGRLLVPRGGLVYVPNFAFPAGELRPWQSADVSGMRVTAVPVEHVGWRYGVDSAWMHTAFTGYVIEYHGMTVYFGGDTAYDRDDFLRTAARFPKIDLALLPVAPIHPREYMRRVHMSPDEALDAFADLGAAVMVPIHFDTFINSFDGFGEAPARLLALAAERHLAPGRIALLSAGQQRVFLRKGGAAP